MKWLTDLLNSHLPEQDDRCRDVVAQRAAAVLRPAGALARMDEIAAWLASWQSTDTPRVSRPALIVFVGDHGVAKEEVSAYPPEVTQSMLRALRHGVATANVLARDVGASLEVVDVGVARPTGNILLEEAMDADRFRLSFDSGRNAVRAIDADLLALGEMGIGNTTAAAAVAAAVFGQTAYDWTGRGTGVDDQTLRRKTKLVERARDRVGNCNALEALRQLGGTEMVAIAGATFQARLQRLPVVLDGFVVTSAVASLEASRPGVLDHCIAGHRSTEPGHALLLEKLGKAPLLDLGLRLGEGSGALAAIPLIRMAARAVIEVATFEEWGLVP